MDFHATDNGFDIFRGNAVAINFAPYVYLKDDRMQFFDTTLNGGEGAYRDALNTDTFRFFTIGELNAPVIGAKGASNGLGDPSYSQLNLGPQLVADAESYFADRASSGDADPFFVYLSLHSPHRPWAVTQPFRGDDTARGFIFADWMREVDDRVGRILTAIEDNGFGQNTMVVFTSDNGPEADMQRESVRFGSDSNGPLRGHKRETYDGGTRVPFMVRWPGQAAPGLKVDDLIWQGDIFATIAAYLRVDLPDTTAPDGESFLNLIRGQEKPLPQREAIVLSAQRGDLALKTIDGWKLIDATGGSANNTFTADNIEINNQRGTDRGVPKQLFNYPMDLGERTNLISSLRSTSDIRTELTTSTGRDLLGLLDSLRVNESTALFPRIPDNDGDTLPNTFELANGLDPDWPLDAETDLDGDGMTNVNEFVAGTNPNDSSDIFQISDFGFTGDNVTVSWPSVLGRTYELVGSTDLVNWFPVRSTPGTGNELSFTIDRSTIDNGESTAGDSDKLFMRVEVTVTR